MVLYSITQAFVTSYLLRMLSVSFHSECLRKERQQPPSVQDLVETPYGISPYTYSQTQVSPQAGYGNPYMQQPSQAPNGEHYIQQHAVASRPPRYVFHWGLTQFW